MKYPDFSYLLLKLFVSIFAFLSISYALGYLPKCHPYPHPLPCDHKSDHAKGGPYAVIDIVDDISTNTYRKEVTSETQVHELKSHVEDIAGVPKERQHLWFDGRELYDYHHMRNIPHLHNYEKFMLTDEPEEGGYGTE